MAGGFGNLHRERPEVTATVDPRTLLVHFLREHLKLTGTHIGCDTSQCGRLHGCTWTAGRRSLARCSRCRWRGAEVTTIEGVAGAGRNAPHAGRLQGASRPAVRLLHPRHGDDGDRHREPPTRRRTRRPSAASWKATSAAVTGYHNIVASIAARREFDAGLREGAMYPFTYHRPRLARRCQGPPRRE